MADIYTIKCNSTAYDIRDNSKSAVTLNGTSYANSTAAFYAPTDAGSTGEVLLSNGSGAPSWTAMSWLVAENPFFYQYDGSGYLLGANFDSTPTSGSANLMNSAAIYNTFFGFTTSGKNYKINIDTAGHAYVNVPWTDNNTLTYLRTSSSYAKYISNTYGSTPTIVTSLSGGNYGAVYSISCVQTSARGRIYANSSSSTSWSVGTLTVAYAGYTTTEGVPSALNIIVVVPASYVRYLVAQYISGITINGAYISG